MATLVCIHTKCRCAANLEPHLCMKFATKFSISPKIAVSRENLGGTDNSFSYRGARWLRGLGKFCNTGDLENLGVLRPN